MMIVVGSAVSIVMLRVIIDYAKIVYYIIKGKRDV